MSGRITSPKCHPIGMWCKWGYMSQACIRLRNWKEESMPKQNCSAMIRPASLWVLKARGHQLFQWQLYPRVIVVQPSDRTQSLNGFLILGTWKWNNNKVPIGNLKIVLVPLYAGCFSSCLKKKRGLVWAPKSFISEKILRFCCKDSNFYRFQKINGRRKNF